MFYSAIYYNLRFHTAMMKVALAQTAATRTASARTARETIRRILHCAGRLAAACAQLLAGRTNTKAPIPPGPRERYARANCIAAMRVAGIITNITKVLVVHRLRGAARDFVGNQAIARGQQ